MVIITPIKVMFVGPLITFIVERLSGLDLCGDHDMIEVSPVDGAPQRYWLSVFGCRGNP